MCVGCIVHPGDLFVYSLNPQLQEHPKAELIFRMIGNFGKNYNSEEMVVSATVSTVWL